MKIGILTFHRPANFGANLQAYSTLRYLGSLGHEVKVIDYVREADYSYKDRVSIEQYNAHKDFVEKRLLLTKQVKDEKSLQQIVVAEKFDIILIGADAVWRLPKDGDIYFAKWLFESPLLTGTKVASLSAAHMGLGFMSLDKTHRDSLVDCLKQFSHISVRDEWTKRKIDELSNNDLNITVNPDPVMMLSDFVDDEVWDNRGIDSKRYIAMTLPVNWSKSGKMSRIRIKWFRKFKALVNDAGYKLIELPIPEGRSGMEFDFVVEYPIDSLQWFLWIKNAKGFCGLRFHAIVSSISCGTPFYSIDSYGSSSRKSLILDMLGLHNIARKEDIFSKIRNLLKGSEFEGNRTGKYIEFENPRRVFSKIINANSASILAFRDANRKVFVDTVNDILK